MKQPKNPNTLALELELAQLRASLAYASERGYDVLVVVVEQKIAEIEAALTEEQ